MSPAERHTRIIELINELKTRSEEGNIIIVEGQKDKQTLEELGIHGDIQLATRNPLYILTEQLSQTKQEIIILTDWDRAGEKLAKQLTRHLQHFGTTPNTHIHHTLAGLVKKDIKDVEALGRYLHRLKHKTRHH